ncbi:MAG: hypothetical protein RIS84_1877, partial [Pseudomonadota bacterium]
SPLGDLGASLAVNAYLMTRPGITDNFNHALDHVLSVYF